MSNYLPAFSFRALIGFFLSCLVLDGIAQAATSCPAQEPVPKDFQWGLVAYHVNLPGYELASQDVTRMAQNGIRWIRIDFAWGRIEPEEGGAFDFSYFDMLVVAARSHGIHIAGTLGNGYNTKARPVAPLWTQNLNGPQYVAALNRYANAVTERYANDVDAWGLENELNIAALHKLLGWRSHVYPLQINHEILRTLSQAVVLHDPSADIVLTLSPAPGWQRFVSQSSQRIRFDTVGLYTYPSFQAGAKPVGFEGEVAKQISDAKKASDGKHVLIFETGYQTPPDKALTPKKNEGELLRQNQATYIETMVRAASDGGADGVYFYQYLDNPDELIPRERVFGLVESDRTPKPAWIRYGEVISGCTLQ